MGNNIAQKNKLLFFETSAKNNDNNISQIKSEFCELIFNEYNPNNSHPGIQLPKAIQLGEPINEENVFNECCCCS